MSHDSAGARLRAAMLAEKPLQLPGAINAFAAMQAQRAGFKALYVSGAGIANASYGLPDLGMTSLDNVCEDIRRISGATDLPLLVDADTDVVLAVHMIGADAPEIVQSLAVALTAGATKAHFDRTIAMHPTAAEEFVLLREPARTLGPAAA